MKVEITMARDIYYADVFKGKAAALSFFDL